MTPTEIAKRITGKLGDAILASMPEDRHPRVEIMAENWRTRRRLISSHVASHGMLLGIGVAVLSALCRVISSHVASHDMLLGIGVGILDTVRESLIATFLHALYA